jgi:hypothetical protein
VLSDSFLLEQNDDPIKLVMSKERQLRMIIVKERILIFLEKDLKIKRKGVDIEKRGELSLVPLAPRGHPTVCPRVEFRT